MSAVLSRTLRSRSATWAASVLGAALLIVLVLPMLSRGADVPYRVVNSRSGEALITARNIKPGQQNSSRLVLRNTGRRPVHMTITQDQLTSGFGGKLGLQIYDATSRRCLYPSTKAGACVRWGAWKAPTKLARFPVLGVRNARTRAYALKWKPRERHVILVAWRLDPRSPNTDQRRRASFRLKWQSSAASTFVRQV